MSSIRSIRFLALAAAFVAAACSDTNSGPASRSVAAVEVIPGNRSMQVGETYTFQGRVLDDEGDIIGGRAVTWVSSNPAVATISATGVVNAISSGTATIAASADSKTGTSQLTVLPGAVTKIEISPTFPMMIVGENQLLTAVAKDAAGNPVVGTLVSWVDRRRERRRRGPVRAA